MQGSHCPNLAPNFLRQFSTSVWVEIHLTFRSHVLIYLCEQLSCNELELTDERRLKIPTQT